MPNLFIVRSATEERPAGESCEDNWWREKFFYDFFLFCDVVWVDLMWAGDRSRVLLPKDKFIRHISNAQASFIFRID